MINFVCIQYFYFRYLQQMSNESHRTLMNKVPFVSKNILCREQFLQKSMKLDFILWKIRLISCKD